MAISGQFASFAITLVPAFGEEFSWRGYLLPRLLKRFTTRRALLVHGFVTCLWHCLRRHDGIPVRRKPCRLGAAGARREPNPYCDACRRVRLPLVDFRQSVW